MAEQKEGKTNKRASLAPLNKSVAKKKKQEDAETCFENEENKDQILEGTLKSIKDQQTRNMGMFLFRPGRCVVLTHRKVCG